MKHLLSILFLFTAWAAQATNTVNFAFSDFGNGVSYFAQTNVVLTIKPLSAVTTHGRHIVLKDWMRYTNSATGTASVTMLAGVYACEITAKNTESKFQITVTNSAEALDAYSLISSPTNVVSGASMGYSIAAANSIFATKTNPVFSGNITWTNNYGSNKVVAIGTNGQFILTDGAATVGGGSGDVTTAQLLATSNGLRTISYSMGDALTNLSATASNYLWGLINAHDSQITTINVDISDISDGINTLGVSLNTVSNFANSSTVALSNNVSGLRSSFVTISNHYILTSNAVHQLSNTVANLSPGSGTAGQYVTNINGTVSNSFRIVSTDGNGFVNALYQNGNTLQITNGTQGVIASYDEDAQVWDFVGTLSGDSLTLSGSFSTDQLNAGNLTVSNLTSGKLLTVGDDNIITNVNIGSGLSLSSGTLSATATGGAAQWRVTNMVISSTNAVVLDLAQYEVFKLYCLTNFNYVLTNASSLSNRAYVYFQQDTNGSRILQSYRLAGGTIQTNANMQPTTNANALDLLEIMPGFFSTNVIAFWPQNFQPRVAFTNSLASGGGEGGACNTLQQTNGGTYDDSLNFTFYTYVASEFTTGASGFTVCTVEAYLFKLGTVASGTLQAKIYTKSGSNPGTLVGSGSATVDRTTIPGSLTYVQFTGLNASLSPSTSYYVVLQASGVDTDASNGIQWVKQTDGAATLRGSTDSSSWDGLSTGKLGFKLYSN